jgi:pyruvate dehydrogenase (quinone)
MVKLEMEVMGLPDAQVDMVNPDFRLVAEAMGIKGITISEPGEIEPGLQEAFAFDGAVLVNGMTDQTALALPPKIDLDMVRGMALSMTKMMLGGKFENVLQTVRSNYKHLSELL